MNYSFLTFRKREKVSEPKCKTSFFDFDFRETDPKPLPLFLYPFLLDIYTKAGIIQAVALPFIRLAVFFPLVNI